MTLGEFAQPFAGVNPAFLVAWNDVPIDTTISEPGPLIYDPTPTDGGWEPHALSADWDDEAAEEQSEDHDDRGSDPEPVQR